MQKNLPQKVLGVDYGVKRIGLAISDATKTIAFPSVVVQCERSIKHTIGKFLKAIEELEQKNEMKIELIVVGMPYKLSGKMSLIGDEVNHFIEILKEKTTIPIVTWDERMTTAIAERALKEADVSRKKGSKVVDTIAASLVLQSYLDHMGNQKNG